MFTRPSLGEASLKGECRHQADAAKQLMSRHGGTTASTKPAKRKKVNFMIGEDVLVKMQMWIPAGERSDFVNSAIDDAMVKFCRKKAMDAMDEFREKNKWKMTDEQIRKARKYGRK